MGDSQRIEDLRRRVQKDPASIAFAQLAEECRRAGNFQEAVDVCRAGLDLHPGYLSARVTLGRALIELNDLDTALAELEHVLKSAPENLAAIRGLAEIHHRQGSLALALAQYRAALALAHNDPDLQRTVDELARQVEPPLPPASADGLSFEQMQDEFLQNLPAPPTPPAPSPAEPAAPASAVQGPPAALEPSLAPLMPVVAAPPPPVSSYYAAPPPEIHLAPPPQPAAVEPLAVEELPQDHAEREQALQVVAVLEQWLDAIHVSRAQPRT
jgi:tetratricopeptide (TPR) repeat protein